MSATAPNMAAAAVDYATRLGWAIFPVHAVRAGRCSCGNSNCKQPGKHPRVAHGLKVASKAEEQIRAWWGRFPDANIAAATGEVSGFSAVDVDPNHGGDDTLSDLERRHDPLPKTARQITGSGGEHILFRHVPGLRNSAGRLGRGLDIRGDGGYIVIPPSLHISGRRYAWNVDYHPLDVSLADVPPWLLAMVQQPPAARGDTRRAPSDRWAGAISKPCAEGRRNDTLARVTGYLLRRYVDPYVVLELARLLEFRTVPATARRCRGSAHRRQHLPGRGKAAGGGL